MNDTPPRATTTAPINSHDLSWRPLRLLGLYRLVVSLLVFGGFAVTETFGEAGGVLRPALFFQVASGYVAVAFMALGLAVGRKPGFQLQVFIGIGLDIVALTLLVHATGGVDAGLGVLMVVAVAGASLLTGARLGSFFAALATLALLGEHAVSIAAGTAESGGYTRIGLMGIGTFATALAGAFMARRARESEALATRRGIDVENLEALSAHIVQRLETGVVALDSQDDIRLVNSTARQIIGSAQPGRGSRLVEASPALAQAFAHWQQHWESDGEPISDAAGSTEFVPRFQPLGPHGENGTLIFLENVTQMRAQVQQAKLASIGRLTASIAHEIRNPLGAMLQAAQLLEEADYLESGERRLAQIIDKQARRLNKTVENVLQLSRRAPPEREVIALHDWLPGVISDWEEGQGPGAERLRIETALEPVSVLFDAGHLQQIIDNLLRNARQHGGKTDSGDTVIELTTGVLDDGRGYLTVTDNGPGIDPAVAAHLFEPFATASRSGTGLGLYLARELCEANQARITLTSEPGEGARFQIAFARPAAEGTQA